MKTQLKMDKDSDNVETKELYPIIEKFILSVSLPFENIYGGSIEKLEFQSRDGFIAHDHNRGGMELLTISNTNCLVGSGEHVGLKIQGKIDEDYENTWKNIVEDNPTLDENNENDRNELHDMINEILNDDNSGWGYWIRVMYEGNNTLAIHAGYDLDAPYYRWRNDTDVTIEIKFKNKTDLKVKLKAAVKKIEKAQ